MTLPSQNRISGDRKRSMRRRQRGGAMVEFAIITPIFITLILWSMYFTELVRARLRLIEAARFITWEMTAHPISDFDSGNGKHDEYYDDASKETLDEATVRYPDLDSIDQRPGLASMAMTADNFTATMENKDVQMVSADIDVPGIGGVFSAITSAISGGANAALGFWKFNTKGKVAVEVSIDVQNRILPTKYMDSDKTDVRGGNTNLNNLTLKAKSSMIVNGWHLRDGSDALMGKQAGNKKRAGGHDEDGKAHTLKLQVANMTFGGLGNIIAGPLGTAVSTIGLVFPLPNFFGTYVVSHNFKKDPNANDAAAKGTEENSKDTTSEEDGCVNGDEIGNTASGGTAGYIDLSKASELDHDTMRCFATAPFRDTYAYKNSSPSLYREMFKARGEWFMGCKNPQADDSTADADPNSGDRQSQKQACGP